MNHNCSELCSVVLGCTSFSKIGSFWTKCWTKVIFFGNSNPTKVTSKRDYKLVSLQRGVETNVDIVFHLLMCLMSSFAWTRGGSENVCFTVFDKGWCTRKYVNMAWPLDILVNDNIFVVNWASICIEKFTEIWLIILIILLIPSATVFLLGNQLFIVYCMLLT